MAVVSSEPDAVDEAEALLDQATGHPLFPRAEHETGPDKRRIELIHIERLKEDSTWEACPRVFKATELRSWKDVVDLFGGGVYRARAQCAKTYQWQGTSERKEFAGPPPRPFIDEPKLRSAPTAPASAAAAAAGPAPAPAAYAPPGWTPPPAGGAAGSPAAYAPPGWTPPPGWAPPGWTPPGWGFPPPSNPNEPPAWLAVLLKMLDRPAPAATAPDVSLVAAMFKANADRDAALFRVLAERQSVPIAPPPPPPPAANPLEMIRELKPLLESNTAPHQFREGIEVAKSLLQQTGGAAPPQEDFASTFATLMKTLSPAGMPGFGPSAPPPPPAPAPPPPAAPSAPAAPTVSVDDVIRMVARDRTLAQRFIEELRRAVPANDTTARRDAPAAAAAPSPAPGPAAVPSAAPSAPAPPSAPLPIAAPVPAASSVPASSPALAETAFLDRPSPGGTLEVAPDDDETSPFDGLSLFQLPEVQEALKGAGEEGRRRILGMFAEGAPAGPPGGARDTDGSSGAS